MKIDKLAKTAVAKIKQNPELALVLLGLFAPKLARKIAPVTAAIVAKETADPK